MKLSEIIQDPEALIALEPDELGLRLLPWIATFPSGNRELGFALSEVRECWPGRGREAAVVAVHEAWAWLEGAALLILSTQFVGMHGVRVLSRRATRLAAEPDPRRVFAARRIAKDSLNPAIREDVWALYHRGKYDTAVFEAMKAVEVAVRKSAKLTDKDLGVPLMRKAFDKYTGPLADMTMDEGEREMRAHLFAGAIGSYKNPHSHRNVALDDPDEAAEIIMLANHLLRIVDARAAESEAP